MKYLSVSLSEQSLLLIITLNQLFFATNEVGILVGENALLLPPLSGEAGEEKLSDAVADLQQFARNADEIGLKADAVAPVVAVTVVECEFVDGALAVIVDYGANFVAIAEGRRGDYTDH